MHNYAVGFLLHTSWSSLPWGQNSVHLHKLFFFFSRSNSNDCFIWIKFPFLWISKDCDQKSKGQKHKKCVYPIVVNWDYNSDFIFCPFNLHCKNRIFFLPPSNILSDQYWSNIAPVTAGRRCDLFKAYPQCMGIHLKIISI